MENNSKKTVFINENPSFSQDKDLLRRQLFEDLCGHLYGDETPSVYLAAIDRELLDCIYPFTMLSRLRQVPQSPVHHPEGTVWNHTLLVVDCAARRKQNSSNPHAFLWAAPAARYR